VRRMFAATFTVMLLLLSGGGSQAAAAYTERPAIRSAPATLTAQRDASFGFGSAASFEVCIRAAGHSRFGFRVAGEQESHPTGR
jgi:hypothetical protein